MPSLAQSEEVLEAWTMPPSGSDLLLPSSNSFSGIPPSLTSFWASSASLSPSNPVGIQQIPSAFSLSTC